MSRPTARVNASGRQLQQALALIHGGELQQAEALCRRVLTHEAKNFNALQLLGHISLQQEHYVAACNWLTAAQSVNPSSAPVYSNLAVALLALKRAREALACCDRALALKPGFPEAHCNRGNALRALDRPGEALASYDRAISLAPGFVDGHAGRGHALLILGRYEEALASCDRALQIAPRSVDVWCLRGSALLKTRRPEEALAAFDRALALAPESPEALNNRGTALRDLKRPAEALAAYERALRVRPDFAEVYCNVANVGLDAGKFEEAIGHCDRALRIRPDLLDALNIRGTALRVLKRYEEAAATYERLLTADPLYGHAQSHLLFARAHVCNWSAHEAQIAGVMRRVEAGENACSPHTLLWITDSASAQLQCARLYSSTQYPAAAAPLWRGERYRQRRLRIAYLSADFHDHPVAHLIAGVLERHDRGCFETLGVSLHRDAAASNMHLRMRRAFEHFWDVSDAADLEVAMRLREREIDIVVDLTAHTRGGRLGILAHRPAPVQINYLGFTGTSGAGYVDYLIGDESGIPADREPMFSERIIRMPHSFLPNDDRQPIAPDLPRHQVGLPERGFVFCAFNNGYKLNPGMFDIWMRLLKLTPDSVLWLRGGDPVTVANLAREAEARGVRADRLVHAPRFENLAAHLARYRLADLFLDTLPYGAHATARDALWAGVPVLTSTGDAFASRVAASLLMALDLPELVAANLEDYAARALTLAHSPDRLAALREKLAHQRVARPAFDTDLYRQHLESAYATLGERHRRGEPAASLRVAAIR